MRALEIAQKRASGHLASIPHHAPSSVNILCYKLFHVLGHYKSTKLEISERDQQWKSSGKKMLPCLFCFLVSHFPAGLIFAWPRFLCSGTCELNERERKGRGAECANCAEIEIGFTCLMMRLNQKPRDELQLVRNGLIQHICYCKITTRPELQMFCKALNFDADCLAWVAV